MTIQTQGLIQFQASDKESILNSNGGEGWRRARYVPLETTNAHTGPRKCLSSRVALYKQCEDRQEHKEPAWCEE
ncbi:uncharacterized protein PGTG_06438 [Puccinia graminis f. sp. tritici CRL 75-36-700-3]|uniref:Uncharacterized protein n=1 Tax=Puccinia graminis f. sp. tritici (strain CRL 75-36-700-3 / race SCCL) TaxID=418459 RepID=E3K7J1_PUCGT|nr:uncharacterized protein PGTG_06438 [Puccinia graminis f. sp. tritici CRL 75-36-700-3]EFP80482.2 hypothetical protein PGTG_06438 [Puccinia graminis f. sp. tritici CRL 75-36-700-3]